MSVTPWIADTTTTSLVEESPSLMISATFRIFAADPIEEPPNLYTLMLNMAALRLMKSPAISNG
jgi:hypothetical protein